MNDSLSNLYLRIFIAHLRRQDTDQKQLFIELGIEEYYDQAVDRMESIDLTFFVNLLHAAENRFGNKLFSAEAGSYVHLSDYGLLGLIFTSCENFGIANEIGYRYQHLVSDSLIRTPLRVGNQVISRIESGEYDPEFLRPYIELETSSMVHLSQYITGNLYSSVPITVSFRHKAAASLHRYMKTFLTPIKFSQSYDQFSMHEIVLMAPIYGHDDQVMNLVLGQVLSYENQNGREQDTVNRLTAHIRSTIAHKLPDLNNCAVALDMSISTLKRKLKESDTSFQLILDHVRFSIAKNMLSNENSKLTEISCVLGFKDLASFRRAFKKWSLLTPSEYQKIILNIS